MAKVSVRRCDKCGGFDSQITPVKRVHVVAIRFDLCMNCQVALVDEVMRNAVKSVELVCALNGRNPDGDDFDHLMTDVYGEAETAAVMDEPLPGMESIPTP